MSEAIVSLLGDFNRNDPLTQAEYDAFMSKFRGHLPQKYVDFLRIANGGEGFVGNESYVILWKLNDLLDLNESYDVQEYAPGLLLFGSDGGGEAFAFNTTEKPWGIVQVPFVGMELKYAEVLAIDFVEFLRYLYNAD